MPKKATSALAKSVAARATDEPRTAEAKRPEAALEALTLAAEGVGQNEIQKRTGLGKRTVRRLMSDHKEAMAEERLKASVRAAESAELARQVAVQRLRMMDPSSAENDEERAERTELLRKTNVRDLSVTFGVMTDKAEKLADQPVTVETRPGNLPSLAQVREFQAEIERRVAERLRKIEGAGNVIEIAGTECKSVASVARTGRVG